MAGASLDRDRGEQAASAGDPDSEPARLGDDRGVGPKRARHREPTRPGRLLLADRVDDQVACELDAEPRERLGGEHHRGDAAFHVARATAVNDAVLDDPCERMVPPAVSPARRR